MKSADTLLIRADPRPDAAGAAMLAHAVQELGDHLRFLAGAHAPSLRITVANTDDAAAAEPVVLEVVLDLAPPLDADPDAEAYRIRMHRLRGRPRVTIAATSAVGVLRGVHAYLTWLGFRWIHKDEPFGTLVYTGALWRDRTRLAGPSGFRVRGVLAEGFRDAALALWASRNGVNLLEGRPDDALRLKQLGFRIFAGGHVMDRVFDPDGPAADGRPLFEAHPEWFGLRNGARARAKGAICVSEPDAVAHLLDRLEEDVRSHAAAMPLDVYRFWGADVWHPWCACERCLALGNATDRYLLLARALLDRLDRIRTPFTDGRRMDLYVCAYEGSHTLEPPTRPLPAGLDIRRVSVEFFPINRCYRHALDDRNCRELNRPYAAALRGWLRGPLGARIIVGEYYNVSQYCDVAVGFSRVMNLDLKRYARRGVIGVHYMHIPCAAWGTRTLTQWQFVQQLQSPRAPLEPLLAEYFERRYAASAAPARRLYARIECAMASITSLTSWADASLASMLRRLVGAPVLHKMVYDQLFPMDHFRFRARDVAQADRGGPAASLEEMAAGLRRALRAAEHLAKTVRDPRVRKNVAEDRDLLRYTALVVDLFEALAWVWHAAKYGGAVRPHLDAAAGHAAALESLELPAGACWKAPAPALQRLRLRETMATLGEKRAALEALAAR